MQKKHYRRFKHFFSFLCVIALTACFPLVHHRGYVFAQKNLDKLAIDKTTKEETRSIMGAPSTIASIDGSAFYYISSREEAYLYHATVETDRRIVAIYFNKNNIISNIAEYGLENGNIIDYVRHKTITRGKELTLLGQLFGNLGRFNGGGSGSNGGLE